MAQLTRAHQELFRRGPDETFATFGELTQHCRGQREASVDRWERPQDVVVTSDLTLAIGDNPDFRPNDWSFSQLCRLAGVSKDTLNRLSSKTASHALVETLPRSEKPVQYLTSGDTLRSVHGVSYTRLWNDELLSVVEEYATDFLPPHEAVGGGSGLYCGEQDLFCFLVDPLGWAEIDDQAFAPGFFVWNSEVGRRSLGIQTFWFQEVCANHIVWDATEVLEFSRKHTANVRDGLDQVRAIIEALVAKRNERRDSFAKVVARAMQESLGDDAEKVARQVVASGVPRTLAREAIKSAEQQGRLTVFAVVDALTRLTQKSLYAGDRAELDCKAASLLALAA